MKWILLAVLLVLMLLESACTAQNGTTSEMPMPVTEETTVYVAVSNTTTETAATTINDEEEISLSGQVFNQFHFGMTEEDVKNIGLGKYYVENDTYYWFSSKAFYFEDYDYCGYEAGIQTEFDDDGKLIAIIVVVGDYNAGRERAMLCNELAGIESVTYPSPAEYASAYDNRWGGLSFDGTTADVTIQYGALVSSEEDAPESFSIIIFEPYDESEIVFKKNDNPMNTDNESVTGQIFNQFRFGMSEEEVRSVGIGECDFEYTYDNGERIIRLTNYDYCGYNCWLTMEFTTDDELYCITANLDDWQVGRDKAILCNNILGLETMDPEWKGNWSNYNHTWKKFYDGKSIVNVTIRIDTSDNFTHIEFKPCEE